MAHEANLKNAQPLAARMRPRTLDEFVGQEHFLGAGKLLRRLLRPIGSVRSSSTARPAAAKRPGPRHRPAHALRFRQLNAVAAGIKEVRELLRKPARTGGTGRRTILFVDEMHRFNRTQQDVLLPDVEEGRIILVGATTQNPFFAVNSPLLSRSQIFTFEPLTPRGDSRRCCGGR